MNIKFKNQTLLSKGIVVSKVPDIVKAKKRITTHEIEGRNGVLMVDKGTYDTFVCSLDCHFNTSHNINTIKEFLDGFGMLSLDGTTEYEAIVKNQIDFEEIDRSGFKSFVIQFLCNPIAHDITATDVTINSTPTTIEIGGTTNTYPVLEIKGSNDVTITFNNKTFNLFDLDNTKTYYLDCNAKEIYDNNGNNCSNQMQYDFPYLKPGNNTISYTGTITSFKISYKRAFI